MAKELKINVPEGYEIDRENSTFECIKFKPIGNKLPKTWEEFCESHPIKDKERYLQNIGIAPASFESKRLAVATGYLPNEETAKAMVALCQLIQLRDCYNDGWVPNWCDHTQNKFGIQFFSNQIKEYTTSMTSGVLTFKTAELRDKFLENFRDLIETAKPLL